MEILGLLSLISVFVFSISAALSSIEKKFDIFGIAFITFITAVGGGTVRDLLLDVHPLFWMIDKSFVIFIIIGVICTFIFKKRLLIFRNAFFLFDTLGISVGTIIGTQKAIQLGVHPLIAIFFGLITAVFGGILRDTMTNRVPLILRKEVYASACLAGGLLYVALYYISTPDWLAYLIPIIFIFSIRIISVRYNISLPTIKLQ